MAKDIGSDLEQLTVVPPAALAEPLVPAPKPAKKIKHTKQIDKLNNQLI